MKERHEAKAKLLDVDLVTFKQFLEWLYRDRYTEPCDPVVHVAGSQRRGGRGQFNLSPPRGSSDFTNKVLAQAKLYVFAEQNLIEDLKTLVIANIKDLMGNSDNGIKNVRLVPILKYVYENTPQKPQHSTDALRALVMRELLTNILLAAHDEGLHALAGANGDLFADLLIAVKRDRDTVQEQKASPADKPFASSSTKYDSRELVAASLIRRREFSP